MTDVEMRLARACARGIRQMGFINELIAGPAKRTDFAVPGLYSGGKQVYSFKYGVSKLDHSSWVSLKNRLINNGFYLILSEGESKIELRFSK